MVGGLSTNGETNMFNATRPWILEATVPVKAPIYGSERLADSHLINRDSEALTHHPI